MTEADGRRWRTAPAAACAVPCAIARRPTTARATTATAGCASSRSATPARRSSTCARPRSSGCRVLLPYYASSKIARRGLFSRGGTPPSFGTWTARAWISRSAASTTRRPSKPASHFAVESRIARWHARWAARRTPRWIRRADAALARGLRRRCRTRPRRGARGRLNGARSGVTPVRHGALPDRCRLADRQVHEGGADRGTTSAYHIQS